MWEFKGYYDKHCGFKRIKGKNYLKPGDLSTRIHVSNIMVMLFCMIRSVSIDSLEIRSRINVAFKSWMGAHLAIYSFCQGICVYILFCQLNLHYTFESKF